MTEAWKPVPGYEGSYAVSDQGRVLSEARRVAHGNTHLSLPERTLKASPDSQGYPVVTLSIGGKVKKIRVHTLVMLAFVGRCPEGLRVLHADDVPTNNSLVNLRYGTQLENTIDCVRNGHNPNAQKTECISGHPFTPSNTRITVVNGRPRRRCKACANRRSLESSRRRKTKVAA